MKYLNSALMILLLWGLSFPAAAQENSAEVQSETATDADQDPVIEQLRTQNPYLEKLRVASTELIKDVPEDGVKALFMIRQSYGILRSVRSVKADVGRAVGLCGDENAELKDPMDARFKEWSDNVTPGLNDQDKNLDAAINKQSYKKAAAVKSYLKNIDDAAEYADKMLDKRVVTTPEACQSLLESMTDTQDNIVQLLKNLPVPAFDENGMIIEENVEAEQDSKATEGETE